MSTTTGMLAVFVDLEPQYREEFREFLAEDMFPPRLHIGFGPCGSYDLLSDRGGSPQAQQFLTVYECPAVGDLYGAPYQGLRVERKPRDAAFHERFRNQDRYTLSLAAPSLAAEFDEDGGGVLADVLWVDRFDLDEADAQAFNIWYETVYLPGLADITGVLRAKRYLAMEGAPQHVIVHQLSDARVLDAAAWRTLRNDSAWSTCAWWPRAPAAYKKVIGEG